MKSGLLIQELLIFNPYGFFHNIVKVQSTETFVK